MGRKSIFWYTICVSSQLISTWMPIFTLCLFLSVFFLSCSWWKWKVSIHNSWCRNYSNSCCIFRSIFTLIGKQSRDSLSGEFLHLHLVQKVEYVSDWNWIWYRGHVNFATPLLPTLFFSDVSFCISCMSIINTELINSLAMKWLDLML